MTFSPVLPVLTAGLVVAATSDLPSWVDTVSRVGVVGFLVIALYGLHRRWWVPGWVYRDLDDRHDRLRDRYESALDVALRASRGVERTATLLDEAIAGGRR